LTCFLNWFNIFLVLVSASSVQLRIS
jgi:hypothetical protein